MYLLVSDESESPMKVSFNIMSRSYDCLQIYHNIVAYKCYDKRKKKVIEKTLKVKRIHSFKKKEKGA